MEKPGILRSKAGPEAATPEDGYPVAFSVEYPTSCSRLKTLLRVILAAPIILFMQLLSGDISLLVETGGPLASYLTFAAVFWIAPLLMITLRWKYPRWCFDTYLELYRYSTRVGVYVLLLRDEYPSLDEDQAVTLRIAYPDVKSELNRFLPTIKWLLAAPHYIVLILLWIAVLMATIVAWFTILIAGRYPRALFTLVEGTIRWTYRVYCYAFMLTTDRYPPFRLAP